MAAAAGITGALRVQARGGRAEQSPAIGKGE